MSAVIPNGLPPGTQERKRHGMRVVEGADVGEQRHRAILVHPIHARRVVREAERRAAGRLQVVQLPAEERHVGGPHRAEESAVRWQLVGNRRPDARDRVDLRDAAREPAHRVAGRVADLLVAGRTGFRDVDHPVRPDLHAARIDADRWRVSCPPSAKAPIGRKCWRLRTPVRLQVPVPAASDTVRFTVSPPRSATALQCCDGAFAVRHAPGLRHTFMSSSMRGRRRRTAHTPAAMIASAATARGRARTRCRGHPELVDVCDGIG